MARKKTTEVKITKKSLEDLKYEFEMLPSGKTNLCHSNEFEVNGFKPTRIRGRWIKTFDCSVKDLPSKIKELKLV